MNNYLFLFTIPSVQEFISQARKTHDLWAGSQIFSELVKHAADVFYSKGGEPIFPVQEAEQFTNRFLGTIQIDNPKEVAEEIAEAVKDKWKEIVLKAIANPGLNENELPQGFWEQINSAFDIKSAYVEWDGKDERYQTAYQEIERLMGALKNVREFTQCNYQKINGTLIYGERGRKCSVDGIRNVKFYRLLENEEENDRLFDKKLFVSKDEVRVFSNLNSRYLQAGEGLSAVSFVKRCFKNSKDGETFPSTAKIALLHNYEKFQTEIENYLELFKREKFISRISKDLEKFKIKQNECLSDKFNDYGDFYFLYDENLNPKNIPEDCQRKALKQYYTNYLKELDIVKYYAVVVFDGDSMGKQLAKVKSIEEHKKISKALSDFSNDVKNLDFTKDTSKLSRVVYSGGDDVLAFVNLEYLFDFLREVRELYSKHLQPIANELNNKRPEAEFEFTISAGVAITHYKTPLGIVLKEARHALEHRAKSLDGKNAVAFSVLKRSGERIDFAFKWQSSLLEFIRELKSNIAEQNISTSFIKKFLDNMQIINMDRLDIKDIGLELKPENEVYKNLIVDEFYRLLTKTSNDNSKNERKKINKDDLNLNKLLSSLTDNNKILTSVFLSSLQLVDFLTRKIK